jgi:hypothetical protein
MRSQVCDVATGTASNLNCDHRVDFLNGGLPRLPALECETQQAASLPMFDLCESGGIGRRWSTYAKVAELADAPDLGSGGETHGGSTPPFRTNLFFSSQRVEFLRECFWHQGICVWLGFVSTHLPVVDCAYDQQEN